jgi:dihydrodipicolinate synthase/N-acetylneuraminate lyase
MKFQATIVFEFNASSFVDAGHKVNDAVKHAREADDLDAKSITVVAPPAAKPVTIPPPSGG